MVMRVTQEFFFISTAARLLGMHPQTLRKYERLGLVQPTRTVGSMRVYSAEELERLRLIKHLVDELGINLAGVQRLLSVAEAVERIRELSEDEIAGRADARRRLLRELDRLGDIIGLPRLDDNA
jgi:MerR family transcriptional regulator/heat shock protein HspR